METIYIVTGTSNKYESLFTWNMRGFYDKNKAELFMNELNQKFKIEHNTEREPFTLEELDCE